MIDVKQLLDTLGTPYVESGRSLKLKCIFHEEGHPSFSMDKDTGVWQCFSCKRSGNVFNFLYYLTGVAGKEALAYVKKVAKETTTEEEIKSKLRDSLSPKKSEAEIAVTLPVHTLVTTHMYLEQVRRFTSEEIQKWQMGVVTEKPYEGWIVVPIYQYSKLQNYFLRSPYENRKLYGKYSIKHVLFGLDTAMDTERPLYIVEGIFDMIFLRRLGVQSVASLTNRLYEPQREILKRYKHIVLVPDNDNPGLELVDNAKALLYSIPKIGVCHVPEPKKDTAACTQRELLQIPPSEESIIDFICKEKFRKWKLEKSALQILTKSGMTHQQSY
jgi:DNA primase